MARAVITADGRDLMFRLAAFRGYLTASHFA
jgi:hypothetical protein